MTIASAVAKSGPYAGNGTQTVFAYTFKAFAASELQVVLRSAGGIETVQTLTTHYTVSGVGNDGGGNVTMVAAPLTGATLTIVRDVPFVQLTDLRNQGGFYPEVHERVFDRLTQQTQQLNDSINRALQVAVSTPAGVETTLPSPVPEKLIGWNAAGTGLQNFDASVLATLVAYGTARADLFDGDGVTTQFTLTSNPGNQSVLDVSIGGVTQRAGVDFVWTGGTTLTFVTPPPVGTDNILARYFQGLPGIITEAQDVTFASGGVGAVVRTAQDKMRESISVKDFGAVGNGIADDGPAIQAAINYAISQKGGTIDLGFGTYRITSTLNNISQFGVTLIGRGSDGSHDGGSGFAAATTIFWDGPANGTMINFASASGQSRMYGGGLIDVKLDCNSSAGIGLLVNSVRNGNFSRLFILNPTIAAVKITTLGNAAMAEASDTQRCVFDRISWRCIDTPATRPAHGIWITSHQPIGANSNTSLNYFFEVDGQNWGATGSGHGIFLEDGDNNTFINPRIYRLGTDVEAIRIVGNTSCDANHFWNPSTGGASGFNGIGIKGTASGFPINPTKNSFWCVDQGNGTLYPTADAGVIFAWHGDNNVNVKPLIKQLVVGDNDAPIIAGYTAIGTETLRVINASGNHAILTNGTQTWGLNINAANGDLRLQRIAGSGAVDVGGGAPVKIEGKQVSQGAVDSGGAGFRVLRVAN